MQNEKTLEQDGMLLKSTLWVGRGLVLGLLATAPWYYGMVTWNMQVIMVYWAMTILAVTAVAVGMSRTRITSPGVLGKLLVGFLVLGVIQLIPLPQSIYQAIAPSYQWQEKAVGHAMSLSGTVAGTEEAEIRAAAKSDAPTELTLSIYPSQTRTCLMGLAAAVAVFFCSGVLFADKLSRTVLLVFLVAITACFSILGIFQNVAWDSWTLLRMPTGTHFATFVNRNSAPQYIAIGIGASISLMAMRKRLKDKQREKKYQRRYPATSVIGKIRQVLEDLILELDLATILLLVALITMIVAVVAAASRGGVVALLFGLSVTVLLYIATNRKWILTGLAGILIALLAATFFLNLLDLDDEIAERMKDLGSTGRIDLWICSLRQSCYWLTGSGMGTYQFAIMPENPMRDLWPRHAESTYVEIAVEFGMFGLALALFGLVWLGLRLAPSELNQKLQLWPASLYSVAAIALHNTVDFSLILPANFLTIACLLGAYLVERNERRRHQPGSLLGSKLRFAGVLIALCFTFFIGFQSLRGSAQAERIEDAYKDYQRLTREATDNKSKAPNPTAQFEFPDEEFDFRHPEVVLQMARVKLNLLEAEIRNLPGWPKNLPIQQQVLYSSPEFVSAVLRSNHDDEPWKALRESFAKNEFITTQLDAIHESFVFTSRACVIDWRSTWGRFQTTTQQNPSSNLLNWSKLDLLTKSLFNIPEVTGTCCLIAGERNLGLQSWRNAIESKSASAAGLSSLIGQLLREDEVLQVLPSNPIAVAGFARAIAASRPETTEELLRALDLEKLLSLSKTSSDWELAAWVASQIGNLEMQKQALGQIAVLKPFDVSVRIQMARILESEGNLPEAIRQLEQAARRTNLPADAKKYLQELRKAESETLSPPQ